jgi:CHAD domain-containing protein
MKYPEFAQETISRFLKYFLVQKEKAMLNKDPEALHRMRVAGRRLRISLWAFKSIFPAKKYKKIKKDVRRACKTLNPARDLDTQISMLLQLKANGRLIAELRGRRAKMQPKIKNDLARLNSSKLENEIKECIAGQKMLLDKQKLLEISKRKISKKNKKLFLLTAYACRSEKLKKLHALRIAAKQLRYTLELFSTLYPKNLQNPLSDARSIQRTLGNMRNCLILADSPSLDDQQLKNKLESLANKSYIKFTKIWKRQKIHKNLNAIINRKKTL